MDYQKLLLILKMDKIHAYEAELTAYLFEQLAQIPQIRIYGPKPNAEGEGRAALAISHQNPHTVGNAHPTYSMATPRKLSKIK